MLSVPINPADGRLARLGERLRYLRERQSATTGRKVYQRDAAKIAGINEGTYRSYEYGRAQLPEAAAKALAAEWGLTWRDFYAVGSRKDGGKNQNDVSEPLAPAPQLLVPIPFVGIIGANSKADWKSPIDAEEMIDVPPEMATPRGPSARFACIIEGDSCYDLLWPEDIAVFHAHRVPRIGQIMVHRSPGPDGLVTVKQIKHDGRGYILHPLNPAYEDQPADGDVLGYLVGIVRHIRSKRVTVYDEHGITP